MRIGHSGAKGILIYDMNLESSQNAVYGYIEDHEVFILKGNKEELNEIMKKHNEPYKSKKNTTYKLMTSVFILYIIAIIFSLMNLPLLYKLATLFFCISSYFPILIILNSFSPQYEDSQVQLQFKRFHGAEHAVIAMSKEEEFNLENIKKKSYYSGECGTTYAQSALLLELVVCFVIINILNIGLLKSLFIIFITIVLLLTNVFNRYNPFFLIQRNVVAKPTDQEYHLALEIEKKLRDNN